MARLPEYVLGTARSRSPASLPSFSRRRARSPLLRHELQRGQLPAPLVAEPRGLAVLLGQLLVVFPGQLAADAQGPGLGPGPGDLPGQLIGRDPRAGQNQIDGELIEDPVEIPDGQLQGQGLDIAEQPPGLPSGEQHGRQQGRRRPQGDLSQQAEGPVLPAQDQIEQQKGGDQPVKALPAQRGRQPRRQEVVPLGDGQIVDGQGAGGQDQQRQGPVRLTQEDAQQEQGGGQEEGQGKGPRRHAVEVGVPRSRPLDRRVGGHPGQGREEGDLRVQHPELHLQRAPPPPPAGGGCGPGRSGRSRNRGSRSGRRTAPPR